MTIIIDNYDSFTYNLVQFVGKIDPSVLVCSNDCTTVEDIISLDPSHIIISPGPGRPSGSGVSLEIIKCLYDKIPILGVCLGHQAIANVFGASIIKSDQIFHGKTSSIFHCQKYIFNKINLPFEATRYHSLVIDSFTLPSQFEVIGWTDNDIIMAIKHNKFPLYGVQFHPESIMSECGEQLITNFLNEIIR